MALDKESLLTLLHCAFQSDAPPTNEALIENGNSEEKLDLYNKFVRYLYFPFLLRFHKAVLWTWLVAFIICIIFGPGFLEATRNSLDLPPDVASVQAINAFEKYYPQSSGVPPSIIYERNLIPGQTIINSYTQNFATSLSTFTMKHPEISSVTGYWQLINTPDYGIVARQHVSPGNQSMITNVYFKKGTEQDTVNKIVKDLIEFTIEKSSSSLFLGTTGLTALFSEMTESTKTSFALIDAVVIPLAILILGANLQSYRHMIIAFCNLGCTLLLAFALLVPVAAAFAINPFAPSIMLSLGVAISFDYSLFMLNRYREEIIVNKSNQYYAVYSCVSASGHVVALSGLILLFTFILLITFPQTFLQSVGITCSTVVFTALLSSLTLTPALLLTFTCFTKFELLPKFSTCCSCCISTISSSNTGSKSATSDKHMKPVTSGLSSKNRTSVSYDTSTIRSTDSKNTHNTHNDNNTTNTDDDNNCITENHHPHHIDNTSKSLYPLTPHTSNQYYGLGDIERFYPPTHTTSSSYISPTTISTTMKTPSTVLIIDTNKTFFYHIALWVTDHPWLTLLISTIITIPLLYQVANIKPTSDNNLIYLPGSRSYESYQDFKQDFPVGEVNPYNLLVVTNIPNSIMTDDYFQLEHNLITQLLQGNTKYIDRYSIVGISYCNGQYINYADAAQYVNTSSSLYHTEDAANYRALSYNLKNSNQQATSLRMKTLVDPNSEFIVPFILSVRKIIESFGNTNTWRNNKISLYLFGGYTTTYDLQLIVYKLIPTMVSVTLVAVMILIAINFGSILLTLRLIVTVGMSITWAYGIMVSIYQPGPFQDLLIKSSPNLAISTGIYWLIPIMSFSILVGLALDYDIFLMSRMMEYRKMGWSDNASICLAVEKTGYIITTAGLIMSISFAGLLIPKAIVLNQYGLSLFLGVFFDTFVIRTVIVPAIISAVRTKPYLFWYPTRMPDALLSEVEERKALVLGYWNPIEYKNDRDKVINTNNNNNNNNNNSDDDSHDIN